MCTFSDNSAGGAGGGIGASGRFFWKQVTISNNSAASGGGIANQQAGDEGPRTHSLYNALVANNSAASGPDLAGLFDARFSLLESTAGATIIAGVAGSNILAVDPQLGPLAYNAPADPERTPTLTRALLPSSPAIDQASNAAYDVDQRFFARPRDLAGVANSTATGGETYDGSGDGQAYDNPNGSDIGAYELQPGPAPVISAITPGHGPDGGGTEVTISGQNLGSATGVTFGSGNPGSIVENTATEITALSPAGSGTVQITVSTVYGTSGALNFTYDSPPAKAPSDPETGPTSGSNVPHCNGYLATIFASKGKLGRTLSGTSHRDVIVGTRGNDSIDGGAGNDIVCAGSGKDTVKGGQGNDRLYGEGGEDMLLGQGGDDKLFGGPAHDILVGGAGNDAKQS